MRASIADMPRRRSGLTTASRPRAWWKSSGTATIAAAGAALLHQHHRGGAVIDPRGIARRDRAGNRPRSVRSRVYIPTVQFGPDRALE